MDVIRDRYSIQVHTQRFTRKRSQTVPHFSIPLTTADMQKRDPDGTFEGLTIITPAVLQQIYKLPATNATQSSNRLAVTGYINQFASQDDLSVQ